MACSEGIDFIEFLIKVDNSSVTTQSTKDGELDVIKTLSHRRYVSFVLFTSNSV